MPSVLIRECVQVYADEPIRQQSEDRLDRVRLADAIAEQALAVPSALGFVIGVVGEWGSGKTSLLHLASESVKNRGGVVLSFDPWMFSGAEELVARFLQELGAQLAEEGAHGRRRKLAAAGEAMLGYAQALEPLAWLPAVGAWAARAAALAKGVEALKDGRERPQSIVSSRDAVRNALAQLEQRVVVTVDDIDRLEQAQIRDVMKLVRLVANFPNTTYLLAYSREAVERALSAHPLAGTNDGTLYLEKIVQASHDIPPASERQVVEVLALGLDTVLEDASYEEFEDSRWHELLLDGVAPLLGSLRSVARLLNVLPTTMAQLDGRVSPVDVVALETLRLFVPDGWGLLAHSLEALTGARLPSQLEIDRRQRDRRQIERICEAGGRDHQDAVRAILRHIFPHVNAQLLDELPQIEGSSPNSLRVCDVAVLEVYLRRCPELENAPYSARVSVDDRVDYHTAAESLVALMTELGDVSEDRVNVFDPGKAEQIRRAALDILHSIPVPKRLPVVEAAYADLPQLSLRLELIEIAQRCDDNRPRLLDDLTIQQLMQSLVQEVMIVPIEVLLQERRLLRLLLALERELGEKGLTWITDLCTDDAVLSGIVRAATGETLGGIASIGQARLTNHRAWDALLRWIGGEQALMARIEALAV